ncbi:MAG: glycerate kinase, partial [Verrucomicrobiales bacterium]
FKGSLTAPQACHAISRGIRRRFPDAEVDECPIADGGEGFVDAILSARPGQKILAPCKDALGRTVVASYGLLEEEHKRIAVLEMAEAAGLWRLSPKEHYPFDASTFGVGELIKHAAQISGAEELVIGIGGSATNDGGAGMLAALGMKFLDEQGRELQPNPRCLMALSSIETNNLISLPTMTVACDVTNPLLGPRGATRIFGPQKGATPELMEKLEAFLNLYVEKLHGWENTEAPSAGAAGGLGFAFQHVLKARLVPGFDLVSRTTGLARRIVWADCVVTGEGSLDLQSLSGKGPAGVALQGLIAAKPIVAMVGRVDGTIRTSGLFHHIEPILEKGYSLAQCLNRGAEILEDETAELPWDTILKPFGNEDF